MESRCGEAAPLRRIIALLSFRILLRFKRVAPSERVNIPDNTELHVRCPVPRGAFGPRSTGPGCARCSAAEPRVRRAVKPSSCSPSAR